MTEQHIAPASGIVPELTLGWRLRMALGHASVAVGDMADYLGVSRETIRRWTSDETTPKRHVILAWAIRTGVDGEWLELGHVDPLDLDYRETAPAPSAVKQTRPEKYAIRDLNPEPAD